MVAPTTTHYAFVKPDPDPEAAQPLNEAIESVGTALDQVDAVLHTQASAIAGKAASDHGHEIAAITGLVDALAGKMPADSPFALDDLTDVDVAAAPNGHILVKISGTWVSASALAVLGDHSHNMGQVTGLLAALSDLDAAIATRLAAAAYTAADVIAKLGSDAASARTALGFSADMQSIRAATLADLKWLTKAVGEYYFWDGVTGADMPPASNTFSTWVELTAGLTGAAAFNENKLASESVTGSAPLVQATATVSLAGSPMNGQSIRLINTEARALRAGTTAGAVENDQMQTITGSFSSIDGVGFTASGAFSWSSAGTQNLGGSSSRTYAPMTFDSSNSPNARAGTETRGKSLRGRYFRRIK